MTFLELYVKQQKKEDSDKLNVPNEPSHILNKNFIKANVSSRVVARDSIPIVYWQRGKDENLFHKEEATQNKKLQLFDAKEKGEVSSDSRLPSVHATSQEMTGEKARQDDQSHSLHAEAVSPNDAKASLRTAAGAPDHDNGSDDSDDDEDKNKRPSKAAGGKGDSKNANDASERSRYFRDSFSSQSKTHGIALSSILHDVDQDSLVWPHELIEIPFDQLKAVTDGFNSSSVTEKGCLLGSGSFGDVYLGHLQWKDKPFLVAVKKFKPVLNKTNKPNNCILFSLLA